MVKKHLTSAQVKKARLNKLFSRFARQRHLRHKHRFPRMRENQIIAKIQKQWEGLGATQIADLYDTYQISDVQSEFDDSIQQRPQPRRKEKIDLLSSKNVRVYVADGDPIQVANDWQQHMKYTKGFRQKVIAQSQKKDLERQQAALDLCERQIKYIQLQNLKKRIHISNKRNVKRKIHRKIQRSNGQVKVSNPQYTQYIQSQMEKLKGKHISLEQYNLMQSRWKSQKKNRKQAIDQYGGIMAFTKFTKMFQSCIFCPSTTKTLTRHYLSSHSLGVLTFLQTADKMRGVKGCCFCDKRPVAAHMRKMHKNEIIKLCLQVKNLVCGQNPLYQEKLKKLFPQKVSFANENQKVSDGQSQQAYEPNQYWKQVRQLDELPEQYVPPVSFEVNSKSHPTPKTDEFGRIILTQAQLAQRSDYHPLMARIERQAHQGRVMNNFQIYNAKRMKKIQLGYASDQSIQVELSDSQMRQIGIFVAQSFKEKRQTRKVRKQKIKINSNK